MELDIYSYSPGRLAIQPIVKPGENWGPLISMLRLVPCRRWHSKEHLWTISDRGPAIVRLLAVMASVQSLAPDEECLTYWEESN